MLTVLSKMCTWQSAEANSWYTINKHDTWRRLSYNAIIHQFIFVAFPTPKKIALFFLFVFLAM